jgi:hypothetical protein
MSIVLTPGHENARVTVWAGGTLKGPGRTNARLG